MVAEEVNKLAAEQEQLGKEIQRYVSNMKKDSSNRKNEQYFDERQNAINKLWKEIEEKNKQIEDYKCSTHNYHTQKYFTQLNKLYEEATKYIYDSRYKVAQQAKQTRTEVIANQLRELLDEIDTEIQDDITDNRRHQLKEKINQKWMQLSESYLELEIQDLHQPVKQQYKNLEKRHEALLLLIIREPESPISTNINTVQSRACNINLPQIKLPIFDGHYEEWSTFRDIFTNVVHTNNTLSNIEKMQYLKTHLRGEASKIIQHLQITSNNYAAGWDILNKRYSNDRLIITKLMDKMLDLPVIHVESASKLKDLHDTIQECLGALNNLNIDTSSWGPIINRIISRKWDNETNRLYEQSLNDPHKIQNLDKLMEFLQTRFQSLEAVVQIKSSQPKGQHQQGNLYNMKCRYCDQQHAIFNCQKFKALNSTARLKYINEKKICRNCFLHDAHISCNSSHRCQVCNKFHHTMLHIDGFNQKQNRSPGNRNTIPTNNRGPQQQHLRPQQQHLRPQQRSFTTHVDRQTEMVFLATAIIKIQNIYGGYEFMRVLIDPGSQSTFITEEAATLLSLPRERISAEVSGLGGENTQIAKWMIQATIKPRFSSSFEATVPCIVLPRLTRTLPNETLDVDVKQWKNDMLADPTFYRPGPIDLILGAKEYGDIVLNGIRKSSSGLLGQNTELGWILSGNISRQPKPDLKLLSLTTYIEEDEQLTKFWQLEEINQKQPVSEEEEFCEKHYNDNTSRNEDGTYTVRIPFSNKINQLGASRSRAVARLLQLEKRFCREDNLKTAYQQFMQEYVNLGHMKISREDNTNNKYFIPHQPVIKESSTTTKLRVVFDASSKTSTGISLNQTMYNGPRLQQDLFDILLRWRSHKVVITADIEKMYRQIKIHQDDQKYQTILWRFNPTSPIQEYKLTTVTYGTTSAPYLAIKTIQRLAKDEENNFPKASEIAHRDFYVDDLLSGADSIREAQTLQHELINMFKSGGFTLRKWSSNCRELIESVDSEYRDQSIHEIDKNETRKSLGIHWAPYDDTFRFKTKPNNSEKITKRIILSEVSKLFNPLGWLAPVIIKAKLLIQDLWLENLKWDDAVPEMIQTKWKSFQTELSNVESLIIPRWTHYIQGEEIEIHGFCDASEKAYGAVIYMKIKHNSNETKVTMLTAKSKVAPTKNKTTLPRLELCSALLLSRLMKKTLTALDITNVRLYAWTDSMITLSWIKGDITRWKTFVANRVSEINVMIPSQHWYHVKTKENPADVISRGLDPSKLKANENWWHGPAWLHSTTNLQFNSNIPTTDEEAKLCHTITIKHKAIDEEILKRFSSLTRLLRVTSYCQKFIDNCKSKIKNTNPLCVEELQKSMEKMVKIEQSIYFQEEIAALVEGKPLNKNSKLLNLNPFCDNLGILRVGGRLEKSQLSYNNKHPIILPYKGHLTRLIILDAHANTLHGGNKLTLSYTRKRYWIINGKKAVKFIIGKCIKCIRYKACTAKQLMGELPTARITPSYPFTHTGVDYAGPFHIKTTKGRGYKAYKGYIALFVCLATKAIHLEVVSDMSADTFLASFKRFISRRGHCSHMYSDNGTNFVGASKILHNEIKATINEANTQDQLVSIGTQWHFIPPSAPHFGGLWEAGVKSMKYHLRRIIGGTRLTYEEMNTLIHQIEACLNSRPLCTLSDDPNEFSVLTPGHFLIGRPIIEPPDPIKTSVNSSFLGTSRLVLHHNFDVSTQADIQHQALSYGSEDEIMNRMYGKEKPRTTSGGNTLAHYSKQDIREQYCISERGLGALENEKNSFFGCLSSHHSSPCSSRSASSFLTACVKQKVSSDENLFDLHKRHPYDYAPYPRRQRYPWGSLAPEIYRHDQDLKSSYFRRKPYADPTRYTWMPSDDESVGMEKPRSILDLSNKNQISSDPSSIQSGKKHVSFARSHTLTSFDDAISSLSSSSSYLNRITKSQERLLDVRKPDGSHAITKQPEASENIIILDKIKRAPMKTQATQTEAGLGRKPVPLAHINLSPRTMQRVKMVSQAAQTNGFNGRKLSKSLSEAGAEFTFPSNNEKSNYEVIFDHVPLQRTQSDEPPRSPFLPTTSVPNNPLQENPSQSETSSLSRSEDRESEDSVESKNEIFIDFKPKVPLSQGTLSKPPLVKTASDGVILVEKRKFQSDDGVVPNIRALTSISHENVHIEEEKRIFTPYFQKAPIKNEGICKPLDDNIYSSIDGGICGQDSIDEEFHENIIYNKIYISRQESQEKDLKVIKEGSSPSDECIVPFICLRPEMKMSPFASSDSLTNDNRDQSDEIWNESQVTVLQVDSGTENGTVVSTSEITPVTPVGSANILTPASKRKHLLMMQHQQRSSIDTEALDEEFVDQETFPKIVVDKTSNKLELPSSLSLNFKQANGILKVGNQRTLSPLHRRKKSDSPPIQAISPLPAVVPEIHLARTDSCKTNTDISESTTTDDYMTANSGTDSSRKSTSFQGLEKQQQQVLQQSTVVLKTQGGSSLDSAKGSLDTFVADDMVVPSLSPSFSPNDPGSPAESASVIRSVCHTPVPQIRTGRSTPSEDSSSCGSYSLVGSTPDLLERYSVPSENLNRSWYGSDDEERSVHYSSSGYYESPVEDDFVTKSSRVEECTYNKSYDYLDDPSHPTAEKEHYPLSNTKSIHKHHENKVSPINDNIKTVNDKPKRSKSRTRSPMQAHKKSIQGRRSPYKDKLAFCDDKNYKVTSDESSTGREYALGQTSPRKSKKIKENNRRKSLPRSPTSQKHQKKNESDYQPSSLPGSLSRRKSTKQAKTEKIEKKKSSPYSKKHSPLKSPTISAKDGTLKALSAESLRSVSPGSDSVFYSDPSSHTTDQQVHCLHCGKEVNKDDPEKSGSSNGQQPDIVQPPAGFEDSPRVKAGRLFKKLEKRIKSEERSLTEQRRQKYRPDVRAKSEERGGDTRNFRNRLRPMARSPFCSKEHLKTADSSPSILPGAPEEDDDQGMYDGCYIPGEWLYVDERDEIQKTSRLASPTEQEPERKTSFSSTESEQDFRKRYQAVTHRMVHRKSCLEMYKRQDSKAFECDKTVVVHRQSGEFGFRIHGSKPVVVSAIEAGTPAESSGLEVGDIVLSVNGISVLDKTHSEVVKVAHAGSDTLTLEVARTCYALNSDYNNQVASNTLHSGYLWKLNGYASGTTTRKWIRRWFCLKQNNCLYYYKTDTEKQPVGIIMLFYYKVSELDEDDPETPKPNRFVIQREDVVPLQLAADSPSDKKIWIEVIEQCIRNSHVTDEYLEETKRNMEKSPSAISEPDCFGYLIKLGTQWKSWSRRYCILKDACLYFYQDAHASSAFGMCYLHGYKVQQSTGSKKHAFEIIPLDPNKKHYYFHTESETDRKRWITALEYSIDRWLKI